VVKKSFASSHFLYYSRFKTKSSQTKNAVARGRMVAEKMDAITIRIAKNLRCQITCQRCQRQSTHLLASLICIPLGYSVEAQATIIKNATTTVKTQPTTISMRVYLKSSSLTLFQ